MRSRTFAVAGVPGVRFRAAAGGWLVAVEPVPAARAAAVPALRAVAVQVERGLIPSTAPLIVAAKQPDGGWPLVVVAVPLLDAEAADWLRGDRTIARDVAEALEDAYDQFMALVRAGKAN